MARLCERPGCSAPASCTYGFDSKGLSVWIESVRPDDEPGRGSRAGVLCRRHADSMVVPIGWRLDDRREVATASPVARPAAIPRPARRRSSRERSEPAEQLALLDLPPDALAGSHSAVEESPVLRSAGAAATDLAVTDVPEQADEIELVVEALVVEPSAGDAGALDTACATLPPAAPWRPVFDQTDDLGGLLSTRSPLLARAFGRRPVPGGAVEPAPDDEPDGA